MYGSSEREEEAKTQLHSLGVCVQLLETAMKNKQIKMMVFEDL